MRSEVVLIFVAAILFCTERAQSKEVCSTAGRNYEEAAAILLRCSSTRPLKALPDRDEEFKANYSFPAMPPPPSARPWETIDFLKEPERYLRALLAYGITGNAELDWRVERNERATWCHAPWMHAARERIHGMTSERTSRPFELHENQSNSAQNWAVGFYNDVGCHAIGRVWLDPARPRTKGFRFASGTYSIKLLFTTAPTEQVPYLRDSKVWRAAILKDGSSVEMRLLQVDVAVRDPRVDALTGTGWIFGTFMYHADAPGRGPYDKLVPVGLMWGNDPELTMDGYQLRGQKVVEGWTNPNVARLFYHLPRHTLGLFGRVNGPVDNPRAACLACHGRALDLGRATPSNLPARDEYINLLPFAPNPSIDTEVRRYFRNLKPAEAFIEGTQSLDYSLQMAVGIENFRRWVEQNHKDRVSEASDVEPYVFEVEKVPSGSPLANTDLKNFFTSTTKAPLIPGTEQPPRSAFSRGE